MSSAIFKDIAVITQGRDITRNWIEPLLRTTDSILAAKGGYDLQLYEEVLRDEQVQSCYQQRFGGLTSCEWEVKAGGDRRVDAKAADSLREMLGNLAWDDINTKQLYALHYGYSVAECMWGRDGQQIYMEDIRVRNRRRFRFDENFGLRLLTWRDQFVGELMPTQKFWTFCVGADHHDEPYGKGLGHWLYWLSYFKRNDMRVWLRYLEKFSQPTTTVEYPPGMPDEQQDVLLKAAIAVANSTAVKLPQGAKLAFLEAARSGTADYSALWDACNEGISKVILSQTMTTDNGSSLSQAQVHEGVARRVIKSDADLICNSFNNGPARWLTDWNYPGAAYPKVWRNTEAESDLKLQAERDKILFDMGFVPAQSYIQESYGDGFALPGEDTPAGLNGTQLDSILQIVDAIQSGTLSTDIGQELITLAVPSVSADIAMRIATPPEPAAIAPASSTPPPTIDDVAAQFAEGDYEFAAKKGGKGKGGQSKNCTKGIYCQKLGGKGSCISAKKVCKTAMSPAQAAKTKVAKPKVSKGGGGATDPTPDPTPVVTTPTPPPTAELEAELEKKKAEIAKLKKVELTPKQAKIEQKKDADDFLDSLLDDVFDDNPEGYDPKTFGIDPAKPWAANKIEKLKAAGLPDDEAGAIATWIGSEAWEGPTNTGQTNYSLMNQALYAPDSIKDPALKAQIDTLNSAATSGFSKLPSITNAQVAALAAAKKEKFTPGQDLSRHITIPDPAAFVEKYKQSIGKEVSESTHFATTHFQQLKWVENSANITYVVKPKWDGTGQGKYIDHFKNSNSEGEIMFPPGSKFKVNSVKEPTPEKAVPGKLNKKSLEDLASAFQTADMGGASNWQVAYKKKYGKPAFDALPADLKKAKSKKAFSEFVTNYVQQNYDELQNKPNTNRYIIELEEI